MTCFLDWNTNYVLGTLPLLLSLTDLVPLAFK
jgi:hypothetical protein